MWRSKLGNNYSLSEIQKNEAKSKRELDRLRQLPHNRRCADCNSVGTVWVSVNLGVFLCIQCGSNHRAVGTHVSLPKGATGTYHWGPDELSRMAEIGNERAAELYGGPSLEEKSPVEWQAFIMDKYAHKKFTPAQRSAAAPRVTQAPDLIDLNTPIHTVSTAKAHSIDLSEKDFFASFGL